MAKGQETLSNDINRLYTIVSRVKLIKKQDHAMQEYLGQIETFQQQFNEMMPFSTDVAKQEADRGKLFMILALAGLPPELDSVRNQILANNGVPIIY